MNWSILNALKGTGNQFEINRVLGAAGVTVYIISTPAFVAWHMARGGQFDVIAFCAAYPAGLGVAIGAIAGAVSWKDRGVETAKVIRDTGSQPGQAANSAPSAPQEVTVVNAPSEPVPTTTEAPKDG